jgi:glycosyltransferase involved in cell wall biosynthesis
VRVVHLITKLELGGAQQNTLHSCRELARRGHDVVLGAGEGGILDDEARRGPFRFVPLRRLVREISPVSDALALAEMVSLLRRERPAIVHTHSSKAGALGRIAAAIARVPVTIHTIHGWSFAAGMPRATSTVYRLVEKACAPLTDHFVSVSRRDLELGIREGIVPADRGSVIRSGIDLRAFTREGPGREAIRREWGCSEGDVLVVNVSNFKAQKAPLDYVRAAGRAAREAPALRFAFVGDGELRPQVEAAIAEEGLQGRMVLAGWRRDVPEILRAADVFALTSLWEGLPRTVLQARACGLAIAATSVNGTPEAVEHGVTGLLVPPGDVGAMAAALVTLAADAGLRRRLGDAASAGLEEFSQERMVDDQEALYYRLAT